jgi:hypothetical protein
MLLPLPLIVTVVVSVDTFFTEKKSPVLGDAGAEIVRVPGVPPVGS